jgi:hypothetical protein
MEGLTRPFEGVLLHRMRTEVMVIGETLTYGELFAALEPASTRLKRTINPTFGMRAGGRWAPASISSWSRSSR